MSRPTIAIGLLLIVTVALFPSRPSPAAVNTKAIEIGPPAAGSHVPAWDARGLGPLPWQGIACLDLTRRWAVRRGRHDRPARRSESVCARRARPDRGRALRRPAVAERRERVGRRPFRGHALTDSGQHRRRRAAAVRLSRRKGTHAARRSLQVARFPAAMVPLPLRRALESSPARFPVGRQAMGRGGRRSGLLVDAGWLLASPIGPHRTRRDHGDGGEPERTGGRRALWPGFVLHARRSGAALRRIGRDQPAGNAISESHCRKARQVEADRLVAADQRRCGDIAGAGAGRLWTAGAPSWRRAICRAAGRGDRRAGRADRSGRLSGLAARVSSARRERRHSLWHAVHAVAFDDSCLRHGGPHRPPHRPRIVCRPVLVRFDILRRCAEVAHRAAQLDEPRPGGAIVSTGRC